MRGIEGALAVWRDVRNGCFASEALRRAGASMGKGDVVLATSLVYVALRRRSLWEEIYGRFLRRPGLSLSRRVEDALCLGTAGILELKRFFPAALVAGLVQEIKEKDGRGAGLVNAVLRRVVREGRAVLEEIRCSHRPEDQALASGIPLWVLSEWHASWGEEAGHLLAMGRIRPYASFRLSPKADRDEIIAGASALGIRCWASPLVKESLRLAGTIFPGDFPGYHEGLATPQSESSMMVGLAVRGLYRGGAVLDMCSGRGIKTGHLLDLLPDVHLECAELSGAKAAAARKDLERLGHGLKLPTIWTGDALHMEPSRAPSCILLDTPCSGSGTWNRHPEGKWRLTREKLDSLAEGQVVLLKKALSLLAPGGIVVYSTCSLMKQENEKVIARVLSGDPSLEEIPLPLESPFLRRGRPWGTYILPELPWLDGFYIAAILKNRRGTLC